LTYTFTHMPMAALAFLLAGGGKSFTLVRSKMASPRRLMPMSAAVLASPSRPRPPCRGRGSGLDKSNPTPELTIGPFACGRGVHRHAVRRSLESSQRLGREATPWQPGRAAAGHKRGQK
jgi:hypothetical protein